MDETTDALRAETMSTHTACSRAIDQLTAAMMRVQMLERRFPDNDALPAAIAEIVVDLQRIGDYLHQLQDSSEEARH